MTILDSLYQNLDTAFAFKQGWEAWLALIAASLGTYSVSNLGDFDIVQFVDELEGSQYNRLTVDWSCDWKRCCIPEMHTYYCEYAGCGRRVHRDCTIHWANENRVAVTLDNYCMEHHPQYQDWMAQKLPARPN